MVNMIVKTNSFRIVIQKLSVFYIFLECIPKKVLSSNSIDKYCFKNMSHLSIALINIVVMFTSHPERYVILLKGSLFQKLLILH